MRSGKEESLPEEIKDPKIQANYEEKVDTNEKPLEVVIPFDLSNKQSEELKNNSSNLPEVLIANAPVILEVENQEKDFENPQNNEVIRKDQLNESEHLLKADEKPVQQPNSSILTKISAFKNKAQESLISNKKSLLTGFAVSSLALASFFLIKKKH